MVDKIEFTPGYRILCNSIIEDANGKTSASPLPAGYTKLEYIENTGTSSLDTNIIAMNKYYEIDLQFTSNATRQLMGIAGSGGEYWGINSSATWEKLGNSQGKTTLERVTICYDVSNITNLRTTAWIKGSTTKTTGASNNETNFQTYANRSLKIFNLAGSGYNCLMKLYNIKVFDASNNLVGYFIPCKNASNVVGMYDVINARFCTNTGTFTAGTTVTSVQSTLPFSDDITYTILTTELNEDYNNNLFPVAVAKATGGTGSYWAGTCTTGFVHSYQCFIVTNNTSNQYGDGCILAAANITDNGTDPYIEAGEKYILSGWMWIPVGLSVRAEMRTNNGGYYSESSQTLTGNGAWQYFEKRFTAPDNLNGSFQSVETVANSTSYTWYIRDLMLRPDANIFYNGTTKTLSCGEVWEV